MSTIRKFALAFVMIVTIVGCAPAQDIQIVQSEERSITVLGEAEVLVMPDSVQFVIGIQTEKRTVVEAKETNDEIAQRVMAVLKTYEIEEKYIRTDYLNIDPDTNYSTSHIQGYIVNLKTYVTVHDLSKFEDIISDVLEAGANQISGIKFLISDLKTYREQARKLAIQAAKEKAAAMASELGQEVGEPLSIEEVSPSTSYTSYDNRMALQVVYESEQAYNPESMNIMALGQISVKAFVAVRFQLK